jgi:mono/diheme cytochrome c family protein
MRKPVTLVATAAMLGVMGLWAQSSQANAQASAEPPPGVNLEGGLGLEAAQAGRSLYVRNCSHCHGFNMVNPGTVSFDLRKFPKEDPERFFHSVKEGKGAMPSWKNSLTDDQIKQLWAYVQTGGKL